MLLEAVLTDCSFAKNKLGDHGFGNYSTCNGEIQEIWDKVMQYSADQVSVLEQLFVECQKPSHDMRIAMIRENAVLSNLDSQQIHVWFETRRIVEKKKKIACEFNLLNEQMAAIGRLLLLENHSLHGMVQELLREKKYLNKLLEYASLESFPALEVQRSDSKSVKISAEKWLLLLKHDYLRCEVQQLHKEKEYILKLLENVSNSESIVNSYLSWPAAARTSNGNSSVPSTQGHQAGSSGI
ncbi:homeobox-leucine zipper protein HOX32 isoform X1 [Daucus carota subsp. sativus]|uniref:homeobox-leucine zipper protein HOX32 isoform X1 n=1 Tax=Daucus carota subsp. sativus TaxID=79200 RepID=UPI0007EF343C|nr:PREDICTED: homeobox-leucine zipper protein HOX32-like isoform X1 [Daucus carota subsp. sativus]